jgi:hypothetical protein
MIAVFLNALLLELLVFLESMFANPLRRLAQSNELLEIE